MKRENDELMKRLIEEEIDRIDNPEDRALFKKLVKRTFFSLYQKNQEMYEQLEQRVFDEIPAGDGDYAVFCGLITKEQFDPGHPGYAPILEEKSETAMPDQQEIRASLLNKQPVKVMQIFAEADYLTSKKLLDISLNGYIKTEAAAFPCVFSLKQNEEYINAVQNLYQLFVRNGIPWKTVNNPYAFKMMDVYLERCEGPAGELVNITEIEVEFKEYQEMIRYDRIPAWNIFREKKATHGFPLPSGDRLYYEHLIPLKPSERSSAYLVSDAAAAICGMRRTAENLIITSEQDEIRSWDLIRIGAGGWEDWEHDYPVFDNLRNDTFTERIRYKNGRSIRTAGELMRFIRTLKIEEYLEFVRFEIRDGQEGPPAETYAVNDFIGDEIRRFDLKKYLVLLMKPRGTAGFLTRDLLSYAAAEVQLMFPEYICVGELT